MIATTQHPFEKAGLGEAPFKFIGVTHEVGPIRLGNGQSVGAPGQPMGTCDYCGTGIANVFHVESANGNCFKVGCECVRKLARENNCKKDPVIVAIMDAKRKMDRDKRHASEAKRITAGRDWFEQHRATFASMAHSNSYWAEKGQTYADEFDWFMMNAGSAGKLKMIRLAKLQLQKV